MNRFDLLLATQRSDSPIRRWIAPMALIIALALGLIMAPTVGAAPLLDATMWEMTQPGPNEWVWNPVEIVVAVQDVDLLTTPNPQYRYTTNDGASWSGWLTDTLEYHQPDLAHMTITITLDSLVDSGTDNRVMFGVTDDELTREYSDEFTIQVDESAPGPPQDLTATPDAWTNTDDFDLDWVNADEGSDIVRAYYRLDSAPTAPGDADGFQDGTDITSLTGLSVSTAGEHTFYVWLEDEAGFSDYTQYGTVNVSLDQETPASPTDLVADPASWSSTNAFDVSWTNPAQTLAPIAKALFKFGSMPTSNDDTSGEQSADNISLLDSIAVPESGANECYIWLEDAAGNADYTTAQMVTLYFTGGAAPTPPFAMSIDPSNWTQTNSFDISWTNPSTPAGIAAAWYKWDAAPLHPSDGTRVEGVEISTLDDLAAPSQGEHTLYVWLEDGAQDRDQNNSSQVTAQWDTTSPSTTPLYSPSLPATGWFNVSHGDVTVSLDATDAHSGVEETLYRPAGGLYSSGNSFVATDTSSWQFYSVDQAGNTEPIQTLSVPIDRQPPTSALSLSPESAAGGWYSQTVTLSIVATDDLSGWNASYYRLDGGPLQSGTQLQVTESGIHNLVYYSRDLAGNQEDQQTVDPVCRIDMDAPTITATPNKVGQYVQPPVNISLYAVDALSGVERSQYRQQGDSAWQTGSAFTIDGLEGDGVYTYEFRALDNAGNASTIQTISLNIDGTPPSQASGLYATPSEWVNTDGGFGINWTNPSEFSGIGGVYYQIGQDPTESYDPTFVAGAAINALDDLSVLTDGAHAIYLWLQDGAGNSSEWSSAVLQDAFKLDRVAPTINISAEGPLGDDPLYFGGNVQLTLAGIDSLSGMSGLSYRIDGGAWQSVPVATSPSLAEHSFTFGEQGRHTIEYKGADSAGNESDTQSLVVRIDSVAPSSPSQMTSSPDSWSATNDFEVCWTSPFDYSGLSKVYYKLGSAPTSSSDYDQATDLVGSQDCLSGITVPQEGATSVYVWLGDRAGNVDHTTAAHVSLYYDASKPTTAIAPDGALGENNYYISAVSLRLTPQDAVSGVSLTNYRINDGETLQWQGQDIVLDSEGEYEISYWSIDRSGNQEAPQTQTIKIDLYAPVARINTASDYSQDGTILVDWSGSDTALGSGVQYANVRYRQGGCGPWQSWLASTATTRQTFTGMSANNFYYFGVQVQDRAGHLSSWTSEDAAPFVYIEGLGNSGFELGYMGAWDDEGPLSTNVVYAQDHKGQTSYMGRLAPDYSGLTNCDDIQGIDVPVNGYASLSQLVQLPSVTCDQSLVLSFRYRIQTYDTAVGLDTDDGQIKRFDPLLVHIRDINGLELTNVMPDGNFTDYQAWVACSLYDSGWRTETIDLTPWAGQRIHVDFRVWNFVDEGWPTWAFVDDVQLMPKAGRLVHLPLCIKGASSGVLATSLDEAAPSPWEWPEKLIRKPRWVPLGE